MLILDYKEIRSALSMTVITGELKDWISWQHGEQMLA